MTLHPVTKILIGPVGTTLVDVSDWMDRAGYEPPVGDLGGIIGSGEAVLKDVAASVGTIPEVPRYGLEIAMRDSADQLVFGGWIAEPTEHGPTGHRSWTMPCVPWAGRVAEVSTGSLNKSGVIDSDRNFLIAMFLDALGAVGQIFGADTVGADDPIVAANVAAGWPHVQATTQLAGTDWSYRTLLDVIHDLLDRVPETAIRIRPDKLVEYGVLRSEAPFVIAGHPTVARMGTPWPHSYEDEVLADDPVAWWRHGEASGVVSADATGRGHAGTYVGGVTLGVAGAVDDGNTAASFDGINDYVTVPDHADLDLVNGFTIEAWFRKTSVSLTRFIMSKENVGTDTTGAYQISVHSAGTINLDRNNLDGVASVGGILVAGQGHHIVITISSGNVGRVYVDGVDRTSGSGQLAGAFTPNAHVLLIGRRGPETSSYFDGVIDEVAIYATELPIGRVAAHYAAGRRAHVAEIVAGSYEEEWLTAGHFNRVRLGGAGAAEAIALDAVSLGRFGRVRNAPYENDEDLPAADVERAAYAKLATFAVRRIARATITDEGLEEGMIVRACLDELGAFEDTGPFVDQLSIYARTPEGEPTDGYRGEFVVQKVTPTFINEETQAYALEMGAYRPDFERAIARQVSELRGKTP